MRHRLPWILIILLLASSPAARADVALADFVGDWQGVEVSTEGLAGTVTPEDLDVVIAREDRGFRIRWTGFERSSGDETLRRRVIDAVFEPTERLGVFAFREERGSFFGLFASPETGNPLEGDTLLWARLEGPVLTVYSLGLSDEGGYDLDRYVRTLENGGMSLSYSRRSDLSGLVTIEGRLERTGS